MKVLFVTSHTNDYIAATLWDGLREVLGWRNVCLAAEPDESVMPPHFPDGCRDGSYTSTNYTKINFDMMVLNACFLRNHDWHYAHRLKDRLKPDAKVVYVEGWDDAHEVHDPLNESNPPFPVDAVFRRELDPAFAYPYACEHLGFAAPERWFVKDVNAHRPWDIFLGARENDNPLRWDILTRVFQTRAHHKALVASPPFPGFTHEECLNYLRVSKICICPSGGALSDCVRTYEAAASGCIPVFVGYPPWKREPWFLPGSVAFACYPNDLPAMIDMALQYPQLEDMRNRLLDHARTHHTTSARAVKLLKSVGMA